MRLFAPSNLFSQARQASCHTEDVVIGSLSIIEMEPHGGRKALWKKMKRLDVTV